MAEFSQLKTLELWYLSLSAEELIGGLPPKLRERGMQRIENGYLGKSDAFDTAIVAFSRAYADQNEKDHAALARAVRSGKMKAVFEEEK